MRQVRTARRATRTGVTLLGVLALAGVVVAGLALAAPTPSAPTIISKPPNPTNATSFTFTFSAPPSGVSNLCKLDGAAFGACTTSTSYATGVLAPGSHTFQVRARNTSDGKTSTAASYTWVIDTTSPPAPNVTSGPTALPAWSTTTSATFTWTGESGASFLCSLDGVTPSACSSGITYTVGQGAHTFSVRARDAAGNTGSPSTTYQWRVDSIAPPAPVIGTKPDDPNGNGIAKFDWTSPEAGVTYQCSKENGPYVSCTTPYTYLANVSNNQQHQFSVRSLDAAGNPSVPASWVWKVDQSMRFIVTGDASGLLYPDVWVPLVLTLHNPNNFPIYVTSLVVAVDGNSTCPPGANVELQQSDIDAGASKVLVPANGTTLIPVARSPRIRLKKTSSNQDACKNQTFGLQYSGTAVK